MQQPIYIDNWGLIDNEPVYLYHLSNANGLKVAVTNFGASIQSIVVPDGDGNFNDVALGYDNLNGYLDDPFYMGAVVGRSANRIANGLVTLDGHSYQLTLNKPGFHHHGGTVGFNKKVWKASTFSEADLQVVKLQYLSVDGEEGYPGNLQVTVTYTLNNKDQIRVDIEAVTDKTTIVNLTQHAYFNLSGHNAPTIADHQLLLPVTTYLPVNALHVPKGDAATVAGTPFDFTTAKTIGRDIEADDEQLKQGHGYDHTYPLKTTKSPDVKFAARVAQPANGRVLNVYTNEPVLHLYSGNFLDGNVQGKAGTCYQPRSSFCLETQQYPDAPNQPQFPNSVLRPGEIYKSQTIFEFTLQ